MKPSRTWVLPNRNALGLVAVLAGMWYAGVTQTNGAAYLLCFVVASVAAVSTVHAWANLKGVAIEADAIRPVFAGEEMAVPLRAASAAGREHFGIRVAPVGGGSATALPALARTGAVTGELRARAAKRGSFPTLTVRLESRYPLGFFTARRTVRLPAPHLIYPAPVGSEPLPVSPAPSRT
ncbi:MAG: hypothetical protein WCF18_16375, partial [Chthoniobacteraceae bacterium]